MSGEGFLSRWSRRKHAVAREGEAPRAPEPIAPQPPAVAADANAAVPAEPAPLPSIESLTAESDFAPFMRAEVDAGLKRQALRTLFSDPRFNVMDGLDVYIDDFSKPDPLPEGWLEKLEQVKRLGAFQEPVEAAAEEAPAVAAVEEISSRDTQLPDSEVPLEPDESAAPTPPAAVGKSDAKAE